MFDIVKRSSLICPRSSKFLQQGDWQFNCIILDPIMTVDKLTEKETLELEMLPTLEKSEEIIAKFKLGRFDKIQSLFTPHKQPL